MGYKSFVNSMVSAANKAAKEQERQEKRVAREFERIQKKIDKVEEKHEKILETLKEEYAKGKLTKNEYTELQERKDEITVDFVVIGKAPYIALAKRYITGKIDYNQYNELLNEIIPQDVFQENEFIHQQLTQKLDELENFKNSSINANEDECQKCTAKKSFFNKIKSIDGLTLCKKCTTELSRLQQYNGFTGKYYSTQPMVITLQDIEKDTVNLEKNIQLSLLQ